MTDKRWIGLAERAREGDKRAFGELVEIFKRPLCATIHPLVHDWHLTQDVAQEAFAAVYEQLPKMKTPQQFRCWLFRIARNLSVTRYRRRRRDSSVEAVEDLPFRGLLRGAECRILDGEDPDRPTPAALARLRRAVMSLPNGYGGLLVMRHVEGMSIPEISEVIERSPRAVRSALYRARILARDLLTKAGLGLERMLDEM